MPINNNKYSAPTWVNGAAPALDATELQAISDQLQALANSVGGTDVNTAAKALYSLINGASALTANDLATDDKLGIADASGATGNNVSLQNLADFLSTIMTGGAKIQTGSYVGTGTYGASNPCSLTFDFEPVVVLVYMCLVETSSYNAAYWNGCILSPKLPSGIYGNSNATSGFYTIPTTQQIGDHFALYSVVWSNSNKTVQWYSVASDTQQMNSASAENLHKTYHYIAIE